MVLNLPFPKTVQTIVVNNKTFYVPQEMLQDKLRATDWEATYEAMEEAVARESYLEWLKENEQRSRKVVCNWWYVNFRLN